MPVAFDNETTLIGPQKLAPPAVCTSYATRTNGQLISGLVSNGDPYYGDFIQTLLKESLVGLNVKYDLWTLITTFPPFIKDIFDAYREGRVYDIIVAEKLMNLSSSGKMDMCEVEVDRDIAYETMENGSLIAHTKTVKVKAMQPIRYSMEALAKKYLGKDLSAEKNNEDSWRLRYGELSGLPSSQYPEAASKYAIEDSVITWLLFEEQMKVIGTEDLRLGRPWNATVKIPSINTFQLQSFADFCLYKMSMRGFLVDHERKREVEKWIEKELDPNNLKLLFDSKIIRPAEPPKPYKNGAKSADGTPKMTVGKDESLDTAALSAVIQAVCHSKNIPLKKTDKGGIARDSDFIKDLAPHSEILKQYEHRQSLQKLKTTELPRMSGEVVHAMFDILKETGRTSSYESKPKKGGRAKALYPSFNCQNVAPQARQCYIPRLGYVYVSVDYSALELVSLAQQLYRFFGKSRLRDQINNDIDAHSYLGAQLAWNLDSSFKETCRLKGASTQDEIYTVFIKLKKGNEEERKFFQHWRKFAKPTGLGYPGGLGAETFITFAKATYGILVDLSLAERLKEIWFSVYPEMHGYFELISALEATDYTYITPSGLIRRNSSYCAAANGIGLQSPSAEGAKAAICEVTEACYYPGKSDLLYGYFEPVAFIHDEIFGELLEDSLMHERAHEIARLWREPMQRFMPDVKVKATPAVMRRWDKGAEAVYGPDGRLMVWEPTKKEKDQLVSVG